MRRIIITGAKLSETRSRAGSLYRDHVFDGDDADAISADQSFVEITRHIEQQISRLEARKEEEPADPENDALTILKEILAQSRV